MAQKAIRVGEIRPIADNQRHWISAICPYIEERVGRLRPNSTHNRL